MGKSTPSEATPAKTRSSKGDPPPAPAPEPEDEGGGSADEVEKELGGGVSEALAEFKAAIGAAGPAPTRTALIFKPSVLPCLGLRWLSKNEC